MAYLKIATTSLGTVVLLALLVKPSILPSSFPVVSQLLPAVSWFQPPYIYVVINFIVLAIAASSKIHLNPSEKPPEMFIVPSSASEDELHVAGGEFDFDPELKEEIITEVSNKVMIMEVIDSEVDKFVISPPENIVSPDEDEAGDPGFMSSLEQHGTLEDAWKAITEGQQPKEEKDTMWRDYDDRQMQLQDSEVLAQKMVKSETFKDRRSTNRTARKELSLSQDELNRRVEAFIKKFNEEMRLQRERSLNRYKEIISRGA